MFNTVQSYCFLSELSPHRKKNFAFSPDIFCKFDNKAYLCREIIDRIHMTEQEIIKTIHISTGIDIPERMNNPLDYEPHPLCIAACKELQAYLAERKDWREEIDKGKMFGVLIVEKNDKEIGYLAAYSGQIGGRSDWKGFVPAVFDYLQPDGYFKTHEAKITELNQRIAHLINNPEIKETERILNKLHKVQEHKLNLHKMQITEAKAKRDARRQEASLHPDTKALTPEEEQAMIKESQFLKAELRRFKKLISQKTPLEEMYDNYQKGLQEIKQLRKSDSDELQKWLFSQFKMLNDKGESKDLLEIFKEFNQMVPPAGSGECCEPKLLQYAFEHGLKPLQMAMFWWGESPKEEIRHHLHFYPACNGKCKPILHWMLPADVFEQASADAYIYNKVEILYEDQELAAIHKPEGMLSVPGKDAQQPSIYSWARKQFPEATGPLIVHRLDMATSGLMVIAKTEFAYHRLQEQFTSHQVQKRYVAIVCCKDKDMAQRIKDAAKMISLPLMPDYLDRPRQIVNHEQGKEAITEYEVLGSEERNYLRLALYPKTGRTHQLRVHCAHREGLDAPILGDPLYGNVKADRLYLHAEAITFKHPLTGKEIHIERKADF
jgi:tRNA pseudouridine32 synthase/23S rRNA pseudouridine746 synthase